MRRVVVTGGEAEIAPLLTGGPTQAIDARKRLDVHRRHYETNLALLDRFPATLWLAGSKLITEAARRYLREYLLAVI